LCVKFSVFVSHITGKKQTEGVQEYGVCYGQYLAIKGRKWKQTTIK